MRVPREHRAILTYFLILLLGGTVLVVVLIGSLYSRYVKEVSLWHRATEVHLASMEQTGEILIAIESLRRLLAEGRIGSQEQGATASLLLDRRSYVDIASISSAFESLQKIDLGAQGEVQRGLTERGRRRFDAWRAAIESGAWRAEQFESELRALRLTMIQLDRLHTIEAEALVESLLATDERRSRTLIFLALAALVIAGVFAGRLLTLLRKSLAEAMKNREELVAREREVRRLQKLDALGILADGLAHDFNNLMLVTVGFSESLLEDPGLSETQRRDLEEIRKAGTKGTALTRELLAFGRQEMVKSRVMDLNAFVRAQEPLIRSLLREDVSLTTDLDPELGRVELSPAQAGQILLNLALNARDAISGEGAVTIRTAHSRVVDRSSASADVAPGVYSRLIVEDNGHGMAEEVRTRASEPFFSTKKSTANSGLGLSTVRRIVTQSGGSVRLESRIGLGTRVEVLLPSVDVPSATAVEADRKSRRLAGGETVLLVEDEPAIRRLISRGLRDGGYEVLEAENGEDALDLCAEHIEPLDLILTDIVMPGLRGPELVERLRPVYPSAKVVFISGYSDDVVVNAVVDSKTPLLSKPFKVAELLEVVRAELDAPRESETSRNESA